MKKFFTKTSEINFITLLISYLAYPLSIVLVKLKIKPNLITFISLLLAIYSSYQFTLGNFKLFIIFWTLSVLLDFSDGQVARISKVINKTAFNFDSLCDLLKIFIIILSSAIYYNNKLYWIVCSFSIFLFLFHEVLYTHFININKNKSIFLNQLIKNKYYLRILKSFINIFLKIEGHSILLFLFLVINFHFAILTLIYMQFVLILNIFRLGYFLIKSNT